MESVKKFEREERYIVVKLKHLAGLQVAPLRNFLRENRVPQIECVVVEHDWPEYNLVLAMLEHRMAGKPVPDFNQWRRAEALQLLLNNRDDLDDQLTSLEQRRYAEQQAREAAEKNADRYRWLLGNADIMQWENMLRCADLEGVESINQFIDAAINHAAGAVSNDQ